MHLKYSKETESWEVTRITQEEKEVLIKYGLDMILAALGVQTKKDAEREIKIHAKEAKRSTKH